MKIKGMLFILFVACVGHIGAMDTDESAEKKLQSLIKEKLPAELKVFTLEIKIGQLLEAPFPEKPSMEFITSYLSLIAQFPMKYKKEYLNKFAKQWYLNYGKELKLSAWIKRNFPGQSPEQVLYYGLSIQDYLDNPALINKIPKLTTYMIHGTNSGQTLLDLSNLRINNLQGLQKTPNIGTVQILLLSNNQLTTIPTNAFAGLHNLIILFLRRNQLTTIQPNAFAGLTNLKQLNLTYNPLTIIPTKAFAGLTNLVGLTLENNKLTTIQPKAFAGITTLRWLRLKNNKLTTILPNTFTGLTKLETLDLRLNPLKTQAQDAIKKALPDVVEIKFK